MYCHIEFSFIYCSTFDNISQLQRMPQIEHNAPKFKYRIYYKLDEPGKTWNIEDIADWKQKELVIPNTDTYTR